jgi:mannosyl-3-phosphoglycerate phosphatase
MTTTPKIIIFTDLDGTLLDRDTYSFEAALPALDLIKERGIPLILTSSKTRAEIEFYQSQLQIHHPFISENGGGVFVPKGYFSFSFPFDRELEEYFVLELGTFYPQIVKVLDSIKKETAIPIKGSHDFMVEELVSFCGLSLQEAKFAKKREYDEPFIIEGGEREVEIVKRKIEEKGLNYVWGGRFHHIFGKSDKGKAVEILKELYENQFFSISSVGIGDSPNDLPMLLTVDHPIFLKEKEGSPPKIPNKNMTFIEGSGPKTWNKAILRVVQ